MFFNKRKRQKEIIVHSPLIGELIPLEEVPDPVFSNEMMGIGVGFKPSNGEVSSPIDGVVTQVFPTKHAIGMKTEDGTEVLLHLGLETVELKGEGFHIEVAAGDQLKVNDKIGVFDLSFIEEKGKSTTTVLVFPNHTEKLEEHTILQTGVVGQGTEIIKLQLK